MRNEQTFINQCIYVLRNVGGKDADLAVVNFSDGPAVKKYSKMPISLTRNCLSLRLNKLRCYDDKIPV